MLNGTEGGAAELFHTVLCDLVMPEPSEDHQMQVEIPGGLGPWETICFWADLEDHYGAVEIVIAEKRKRWLWWHT